MKRQSCDSSSLGYPYRWMVPVYENDLVVNDFDIKSPSEENNKENELKKEQHFTKG